MDSFAGKYGRPYKFVQALTGSTSSAAVSSQAKVDTSGVQLADALHNVVKAIRDRVGARVKLVRQLTELGWLPFRRLLEENGPNGPFRVQIAFDEGCIWDSFAHIHIVLRLRVDTNGCSTVGRCSAKDGDADHVIQNDRRGGFSGEFAVSGSVSSSNRCGGFLSEL